MDSKIVLDKYNIDFDISDADHNNDIEEGVNEGTRVVQRCAWKLIVKLLESGLYMGGTAVKVFLGCGVDALLKYLEIYNFRTNQLVHDLDMYILSKRVDKVQAVAAIDWDVSINKNRQVDKIELIHRTSHNIRLAVDQVT